MIRFKDNINEVITQLRDIAINSEVVLKRHKHSKAERYYNIPSAFDIETTSTYIDDNKRAWMYEWTFGIKDLVVYGRSWDEFKTLLWFINRIFNKGQLVVYIHNMSYEFQFLKGELNLSNVFATDSRNAIRADYNNIQFRDSLILSGLSLAKTADNLINHNIDKLVGDLDYSVLRYEDTPLSQLELDYCRNDVLIILYYIQEQITEFGSIAKIPMTNTGRVRNYCKEHTLKTTTITGREVRNWDYIKLMKTELLDDQLYNIAKLAFRGGFTHSSLFHTNITLNNVGSYDLTSAYPSVMVGYHFPVGSPDLIKEATEDEISTLIKNKALLMKVEFYGLELKDNIPDTYISWISSKMEGVNYTLHNGRIYKADYISMYMNEIDYKIIRRTYNWKSIKFSNIYIWNKGRLPKELIDCVLHFYENKTKLKGVKGKEAEYQNSKGMLNSTYGMMVQDPVKDSDIYENNEWLVKSVDINSALNAYNNSSNRFTYYIQGLWITAYCRLTIWRAIIECGYDYVYTDTDSVKMLNPEAHREWFNKFNDEMRIRMNKAMNYYGWNSDRIEPLTIKGVPKLLGAFDFEGVYDKFKTLGAKRYMTLKNGEYELTCSGVVKGAVDYIVSKGGFDEFNLNLIIPPENTGKLLHTYIDDQFIEVSNNEIVQSKSSVHLEPTGYSMNPADEWLSWLLSL